MLKHRTLFILTVFLTVANILVWSFLGFERAYAHKVYPGIWVQAQPLAGLTRDQAIDRLKPVNDAMLLQKVTLILNDKEYTPTLEELGYRVDTAAMADASLQLGRGRDLQQAILSILDYQKTRSIPIVYDIDQGKFDNYLNEIGKEIIREPKNMNLEYKDGNLVITPAEDGITLDRNQLKQAIQREARPGKTAVIQLSIGKQSPVITNEAQLANVKEKLTKLLAKPLVIQAEEVTHELSPAKMYTLLYFDVVDGQLTVGADDNKIQDVVSDLAKKVDRKAVAKQVSETGNTTLQEGQDGRALDVPDTTKRIKDRLTNADTEAPVVVKVSKIDRKTVTISPEYQLGRYPGRYIEVDLSAQRLHFIEGENYHKTAIISTGKWDMPTPTGEFKIMNHIEVAWSKKYALYMPKWMALKTAQDGRYEGYGIHGLPYWPNGVREGTNHLGRPVSHGCIRLGEADINYLYEWAPNETPVVIHN